MKYFENCTALVTGASSGLGREFARQLAPHARALVLVARRLDRLNALREELTQRHPELAVFCCHVDLANEQRVDDFLRWLHDSDLRVNVLINNAGLGDHRFFDESDWSKIKRILEVNIVALTKLTHGLLPAMLEMERAAVFNVSSVVGLLYMPNMAVYAASKAYITSLSESLRAELRGTPVRVTALCPGPVDTEFRTIAERESGQALPAPEIFKLSPEDVVRGALAALAKDRPRLIPGLFLAAAITAACAAPMFLLRVFLRPPLRRTAQPRSVSPLRSLTSEEPRHSARE